MKSPETQNSPFDAVEWEKRKRGNKRLGYIIAAIVLAIFLGSIWKYRPF
ncbi:MAG TPA: cytochrome oxidase small assembly protein [Rhodoferax sp.]|nr:cytochrome oxidase small assembly protein [Rhodoferax sp.]